MALTALEIFKNLLDNNLPNILNVIRNSIRGNEIILIQNQNFKKDGLYITAKKIMGHEVDIETIEFKTKLDGKHFIMDSLVAYNNKYDYTIPLNNFFNDELVSLESYRMGIMGSFAHGQPVFEY